MKKLNRKRLLVSTASRFLGGAWLAWSMMACGDGTLVVSNYFPDGGADFFNAEGENGMEGQWENNESLGDVDGEDGEKEEIGESAERDGGSGFVPVADGGNSPGFDDVDGGSFFEEDSGADLDSDSETSEDAGNSESDSEDSGESCETCETCESCDAGTNPTSDSGQVPEPDPLAWVPPCSSNCPTVIESLPFSHRGNTRNGRRNFDRYSCATNLSESGPEEIFVFHVTEPGTIVAGLTEPSQGDVDIHLLSDNSAKACLNRGDKGISRHLTPGVYYLAMDTYASDSNAGEYGLNVLFLPDSGKCGLNAFDMERFNSNEPLPMPATGKVVKEAHLVTTRDQAENGGSSWWPSSSGQYLATHKQRTATLTGISYNRTEAWAPAGEGGCQYGQGSTGKALPEDAEAWYVCMYWKGAHRPKPGTKYLVVNPATGKSVVAAAGYETGPGDVAKIGGAVEEIHHVLGTSHGGTLTFGELKNQSLSYGIIDCR